MGEDIASQENHAVQNVEKCFWRMCQKIPTLQKFPEYKQDLI